MTPDWLDPELLRWAILAVLVVLAVLAFMVLRIIRKVLTKVLLLVIIAALGTSLLVQRNELADCVETCSCSLYGFDVEIPEDERLQFCPSPSAAG